MMKKVLSTGGAFTDNGKTYVVNGHRFNCDNLLDIATSKAFKPTFVPDALEICKKITTTIKDQNGQLCNLCYGCAYQPIGDNASPVVPVNITTTEFVDDEYNKKHALQVKLSQADMNLLKSCADNYDANFLNIATKLADLEHTPLRAFVFYILSHYQLKVTDRFRQAPQSFVAKSDEADSDKAIKNYSNLLISSVNNSANVVINSFLIFVKSKNELDNMSLIDAYDHSNLEYAVQDKISQVVADYLSTEKIENLATLPTMDDLLDLSDQAKEELNLILANADLNKLDFKTEFLNDNVVTPQIAWNALVNSLEETYRIFSYGLSSQEIQSAFRLLKDDVISFYPGIFSNRAIACDLYHRTCSKPINEEQLKFFDPLVNSYEQDLMKEYAGVAKVEQEYLDYDIGLCYDTKVDWKELVERLHDEYEDPSELNEDTIQSAFKLIDDDNFSPCTRLAILQNMYSFVGEIITPA